ncbi:8-amino-7-oxononanoate synthase [Russula earlei]|uniref:8-amino-7-oxononanoate synthase n=1 Tax=Russula earlei TaxID=71964 RepID=A0ACC0TV02_9AGAM|nr:8-amino-7-oxononanoate synthase [Russula earlei]
MYHDDFLQKKLEERRAQNAFRQLRLPEGKTDFCSNDYLGMVYHDLLKGSEGNWPHGSSGSRLLAGNYALAETTEKEIAVFHESEAALLFNSGYDANLGLLSCVPQRGDTIIYDSLAHASIRDGIRLSFAQSFSFVHNDLDSLEKRLQQVVQSAESQVFVVTESVFSMDGDQCPLPELVALCEKYTAHLIVDEAHATGVIGEKGEGLVQQLRLQQQVFARVHTFGKACGCHGAVVLGSVALRDYLVNFARSFIYSTSLPPQAVAVIRTSYRIFPGLIRERAHLLRLVQRFQLAVLRYDKLISHTPIQIVIVPGNEAVKELAAQLREHNLDVRPILYPTVPKGKERLRIVLHAFNTMGELDQLIRLLR